MRLYDTGLGEFSLNVFKVEKLNDKTRDPFSGHRWHNPVQYEDQPQMDWLIQALIDTW